MQGQDHRNKMKLEDNLKVLQVDENKGKKEKPFLIIPKVIIKSLSIIYCNMQLTGMKGC